ncbi:MAG TPA: carbohydrate ABC transporter permease [Clostridiaceae bacterium]|nr:carbohydrate ABC transporter permease [Clostridiaceae bacterium]
MKKVNAFMYAITIIICLISIFPFYWLINTSLQPPDQLFNLPPNLYPKTNVFIAYAQYIAKSDILLWMKNTLIVGIIVTIFSTGLGLPAAYSLSRFRYKLKTLFIFIVLFTQMMSASFLCIPIYIIFSNIKFTNSLATLMVIYTCTTLPISVWFAKGFFDGIPVELEDSARIDGCNTFDVLVRILIPLIRPGIIATGTWVFIVVWDEYLFAYTMIERNTLWTNSVGLASYIGQYSTPWNEIMTGAVLVTLPVVLLFMYFQKYLVSGLTAGSVKG